MERGVALAERLLIPIFIPGRLSQRLYSSTANLEDKAVKVTNKIDEWIKRFQKSNISEPRASSEIITAFALKTTKISNFSNRILSKNEADYIDFLCEKRLSELPIQYVIEEWDFGGLTLKMKPPVFIPRPETQGLVDVVIEYINSSALPNFKLLEVGCGSGAISLAILHAFNEGCIKKKLSCTAVDKNKDAVALTKLNAASLKLNNFQLFHCDVSSLPRDLTFDGIVSNPPYIPSKEILDLQPEISRYESRMALDGGPDGLSVVKEIVNTAQHLLPINGWIWLEVDTSHPSMMKTLFKRFVIADIRKDIFDRERFVKLIKHS